MTGYLVYFVGIVTLGVFGTVLGSTRNGILAGLAVWPIVTATWPQYIGPIRLPEVFGAIFPILVLGKLLMEKKIAGRTPFLGVWLVYIGWCLFSYSFAILQNDIHTFLSSSFRLLHGFVAFLALQYYFDDRENFRKLLIILIIAGIFPVVIGIYQAATGAVWYQRHTVGLARNVGLYHDGAVVRFFMFQTLTAIFLYWAYFLRKSAIFMRLLLLVYCAFCFIILFKVYSKAAYAVLISSFIIWSIFSKKYIPTIIFLMLCVVLNVLFEDQIWQQTNQVFIKEISVAKGNNSGYEMRHTLGGRGFVWEHTWGSFMSGSVFEQVFGNGDAGATHNDFLARLVGNGLIGLVLYVVLLTTAGFRILGKCLRASTPLNVMALMLISMWLIDATGLVPTQYTAYQWHVWGLIGLALRGVDWGETEPSEPKPAASVWPEKTTKPVRGRPTPARRRARSF